MHFCDLPHQEQVEIWAERAARLEVEDGEVLTFAEYQKRQTDWRPCFYVKTPTADARGPDLRPSPVTG